MKAITSAIAIAVLGIGLIANTHAQGRHDEKPHGMQSPSTSSGDMPEGGIALKDGGKLIMEKDGTTYHVDSKGRRVRMRDGVVMEAEDGTRYMMKNNAVWKAITEKGTLHPNHQ